MSGLNVAFVVQGEGRGHMTQALALAGFLRDAGHQVVRVLVGKSPRRSVPSYFTRQIGAPLETFAAPTQVPDQAGLGLSIGSTVRDAAWRMPSFIRAGFRIHEATRGADVVVNFYDLVGGLSRIILRSRVPAVAVAHNYLFLHPELSGAPGPPQTRRIVMAYTRGTAGRAETQVALAFQPLSTTTANRLVVSPPLVRPGLDEMSPRDEGHLLAYVLNPGYGDLLAAWHRRNPDVRVHCYLEGGAEALGAEPAERFQAHPLDDQGFLRHLVGCRAYVGSAGFESICEAFYLGKPALVVPTAGQYEQTLNAWDAERVGAARAGTYADLDAFWRAPPLPSPESVDTFRAWVARAPQMLVDVIERAAAGRSAEGG